MDQNSSSTNTHTEPKQKQQPKILRTIPVHGNLEESLQVMDEEQIQFNLIELNLVSMYNDKILDKLYDWSKQTSFYLKNRYLLEKIINSKSKANVNQRPVQKIVQKYDTVYVNGCLHDNARQKAIIKHGLNKQLRAHFIGSMEQFSTLLDDLSLALKNKSKELNAEELECFFVSEIERINNCQVHAIISPNKIELAKTASVESSSSESEEIDKEIPQTDYDSPKKMTGKSIFSLCFKGAIHRVRQIMIENSSYLHTKNRCPLVLNFGFSRFIYKNDNQLSHELISMHLIKYLNRVISGSSPKQHIISYQILPQAHGALYEFIENSMTVNQIKMKFKGGIPEYLDYLEEQAAQTEQRDSLKISNIRKRFAQTFAGFCCCQYLLELKDRNNSNIMIRNDGSIFHIDLAFIFSATPGGIGFQNCPFKFTSQYLNAMGGFQSECFKYYESLMISNLTKMTLNREEFLTKISILSSRKDEILCFKKFKLESYKTKICKKTSHVQQLAERLIGDSYDNWRTKKYDDYQYNTNKILV